MRLTAFARPLGLAALLTFALASTAYAQDVAYNAMPNVDFSKFKTYKWVTVAKASMPDSITDAQIKTAIDAQLVKKGMTKTDADTADLYVAYQAAVDTEKEWSSFTSGMGGGPWGYGMGGYYGGMGMGTTTTTSYTIHIGSIQVDMYDRAAKELVWKGTASKTIDVKAKPDKRQNNINKAMEKMLKNYPPPVKKK
jgi:hypothetical protein